MQGQLEFTIFSKCISMISVGYMFSGLGLQGNPLELIRLLGKVSMSLLSFANRILNDSVGYMF